MESFKEFFKEIDFLRKFFKISIEILNFLPNHLQVLYFIKCFLLLPSVKVPDTRALHVNKTI